MKRFFFVCLLFLSARLDAQPDFGRVDQAVAGMDARTPELLAEQILHSFSSEREKARAVYSWIAQHISYNTGYYRPLAVRRGTEDWDQDTVWKSGVEMTARKVMFRRMAVCDGYSKLFQTLCTYVGLRSELINGYARGYGSERFRTNHTWNAVRIDSVWYLVDVTWGSGYMDYADRFVAHMNETYFLAVPRQFIYDHYPEDPRWTLMDDPPVLREFRISPFIYKSYVKYGINTLSPSKGLVEGRTGDTLRFEIKMKDRDPSRKISSDPFFDSTMLDLTDAIFLDPLNTGNKIRYQYVLNEKPLSWIYLKYNGDIILRYYVNRKGSAEDGQASKQ